MLNSVRCRPLARPVVSPPADHRGPRSRQRPALHGFGTLPAGSKVACVLSSGNLNLERLRGLTWN
jgi:hypothetical protein